MNNKLMAALKRIGDVLHEHKAEIHFSLNMHDLGGGRHFTENMYGVHISKNDYHDINAYIGTQVKRITEKELSLPFIQQECIGTEMPPKEVLAMLADLHSVFRDLNLSWNGVAPFMLSIGGDEQMDIGYYLKYSDTVKLRAKLQAKTAVASAAVAEDALFEFSRILKTYDAEIYFKQKIWPGGGQGESKEDTVYCTTMFLVGEARLEAGVELCADDALCMYVREQSRPFKSFLVALYNLLRKYDMSISNWNDIYIEDVCVDHVTSINWYNVYQAAQHIDS